MNLLERFEAEKREIESKVTEILNSINANAALSEKNNLYLDREHFAHFILILYQTFLVNFNFSEISWMGSAIMQNENRIKKIAELIRLLKIDLEINLLPYVEKGLKKAMAEFENRLPSEINLKQYIERDITKQFLEYMSKKFNLSFPEELLNQGVKMGDIMWEVYQRGQIFLILQTEGPKTAEPRTDQTL